MDDTDTPFTFPTTLPFAALRLHLTADGTLVVDTATLERLCAGWNVRPEIFDDPGMLGRLLLHWYGAACERGEPRDAVMDQLLGEAAAAQPPGEGWLQ